MTRPLDDHTKKDVRDVCIDNIDFAASERPSIHPVKIPIMATADCRLSSEDGRAVSESVSGASGQSFLADGIHFHHSATIDSDVEISINVTEIDADSTHRAIWLSGQIQSTDIPVSCVMPIPRENEATSVSPQTEDSRKWPKAAFSSVIEIPYNPSEDSLETVKCTVFKLVDDLTRVFSDIGIICLDPGEVIKFLNTAGTAVVSIGEAAGANRTQIALEQIRMYLSSTGQSLTDAQTVLCICTAGDLMKLEETMEIYDILQKWIGENAFFLIADRMNQAMHDRLRILLLKK